MILQELFSKALVTPPRWLPQNTVYMTIMGSIAYQTSDDKSDFDIYGFCIPPKDLIWGKPDEIPGFGRQIQRFESWQQHHVNHGDKEYDFNIMSIVQFFNLAMNNNPNVIDAIFTPNDCVLHQTKIAKLVRDNANLFLHKGYYHKSLGYAYSQIKKLKTEAEPGSRREADIKAKGYDSKHLMHAVRLALQCQQVLEEGTIDLTRHKDRLRLIRAGGVPLEKTLEWFSDQEKFLLELYKKSTLKYSPDEGQIKELLVQCLKDHYGNIEDRYKDINAERKALMEIQAILDKVV